MSERITIMMDPILKKRVEEECLDKQESLTNFYNSAILNELERRGDFDIRDILERDKNVK